MKSSKTVIPLNLRKEMESDPFYKICALFGQGNHTCEGRITWEHAIIYAGQKIQKKWAIIPLCAKGHDVDEFQDSHSLNKEMNHWVALNRATQEELEEYTKPNFMLNKVDYFKEREILNRKYGKYEPKNIIPLTDLEVKECCRCRNGKKIVLENPNGFVVRELLCKKCFTVFYPRLSAEQIKISISK